jgi:hypothetical protein
MKNAFNELIGKFLDGESASGFFTRFSNKFNASSEPIRDNLVIGKYRLEKPDARGFILPYDGKYLSTLTRQNITLLQQNGWTFSKIIVVPVANRNAASFYLLGKDNEGHDVIYARKETSSPVAGQTKIYWGHFYTMATTILDPYRYRARE